MGPFRTILCLCYMNQTRGKTLVTSAIRTLLSAKEHQSAAVGCREEIDAHLREFAAQAVNQCIKGCPMILSQAKTEKNRSYTGDTSW